MSHNIEEIIQKLLNEPSPNEPNAQQLRALVEGEQKGPFHFLNLLAFKDKAEYPIDHTLAAEELTGSEAYDKYGAVAFEQVVKRGGRLMTLATVEKQLIGSDKHWDRIATMEYQHIDAFIDMIVDPEYRAALPHRDAGLKATEVIVTRPVITTPVS